MSAFTTLRITESKAKKLLMEYVMGEIPTDVLGRFMDKILEDRLYNATIVPDYVEENDDEYV